MSVEVRHHQNEHGHHEVHVTPTAVLAQSLSKMGITIGPHPHEEKVVEESGGYDAEMASAMNVVQLHNSIARTKAIIGAHDKLVAGT